MKFYKNTDTVDIDAKSIGISNNQVLDDRGLKIQIRHNGNKELFEKACKMAEVIVKALNEEFDEEEPKVELVQTFECPFCGFDSNTESELDDCCDEAQAGGFSSDDEYNVGE